MFNLRITSVALITFILAMSINHSETKNSTSFVVELTKTKCFNRLKISHWRPDKTRVYLENIFPFYYHYPIRIQFVISLSNLITRNESFNRNFPFRTRQPLHEMLHCDKPNFGGKLAAVFTLTITNFTLTGYYLHCVNSSPLN